jgi:hypothetical protein
MGTVARTVVVLFPDRILHLTCHSEKHALSILRSYPDALESSVYPATADEQAMMDYVGVIDGETMVGRMRIDEYFAWLGSYDRTEDE